MVKTAGLFLLKKINKIFAIIVLTHHAMRGIIITEREIRNN